MAEVPSDTLVYLNEPVLGVPEPEPGIVPAVPLEFKYSQRKNQSG